MSLCRRAKLFAAAAIVLFSSACGRNNSSSTDAGPPVVIYQVADLQLTSLQVDARNSRDGDLTNEVSVQVNFPIRIEFGVTQTGGVADTQFSFGLMQQLTAEEAAGETGNQKTCFLGSTTAHHPGDGTERHYDATFIVPPECVSDNEPTVYNLYAGIDVPGQVDKTENRDDNGNIVIYNQDMLEETRNQNCKRADGTAGCILSVTVNPSPGVNLTFASMELDSSVAVIEPLDENTGGTDDDGNPVPEVHTPFAKVLSTLTLAGVNMDDATAVTDKNATVTYTVCPESLYHDTCSGDAWMPLTIATPDTANNRSGHAASFAVPELRTGQPNVYAHELYAEGDTFDALALGDWAAETTFVVRGCLASDVEEKVAGTDDGSVAKRDNCVVERVTAVRSDNSFRKAFATVNYLTGTASSYTFTDKLVQRAGDPKTIRVDTVLDTDNVLNVDGASSRNLMYFNLAGKVDIRAAGLLAKAASYVSATGSYIEVEAQMLKVDLYSFRKEVPDEFTKEAVLGYVRESCATFGYNALVLSLEGSMCVGGKIGLKGVLTVRSTDGGQAPFDAAQRTGLLNVSVGPTAEIHAITKVVSDAAAARGELKGTLRLIEMDAPISGNLQWGLTNADPLVLAVKGTVKVGATLAALDGDIEVSADLREVDMCTKKWKVCGRKFKMRYPCGFRWNPVFYKKLVDFTGDKRGVTLLSRSAELTLQ